jgi:hypothetical protein
MLSKVTWFSLFFLSFAPIFGFFAPFHVYESSPLLIGKRLAPKFESNFHVALQVHWPSLDYRPRAERDQVLNGTQPRGFQRLQFHVVAQVSQ